MRRSGVAAIALAAVVVIALVARSQLRQSEETAPADSTGADSVVAPGGELQPDTAPSLEEQHSDTTASASQPQRPVVSEHIPPVEPPGKVVAAPEPPSADQEAEAVLQRAAAAYAGVRSMRADFVQRRENPLLGSTTTSRGTLYQRSPDRFALRYSQPAGDAIVADGKYFWVYYPSADRRQVIRAPASPEGAGAVDLKAQFIGNPLERFRYTYHGTEQSGGRRVHVLTLVPRQNAGYQSLKVWIDGMDSLIRRFIITEPNGTKVEFELSNLTVNPRLDDDVFRFTPPADAVIVER